MVWAEQVESRSFLRHLEGKINKDLLHFYYFCNKDEEFRIQELLHVAK